MRVHAQLRADQDTTGTTSMRIDPLYSSTIDPEPPKI